ALGLPNARAIEIMSLEPDAPVARAGLQTADLVVAIGDRPVETVDDVHRRLVTWPIGDALTLTIVRGAERRQITVTPIEAPWAPRRACPVVSRVRRRPREAVTRQSLEVQPWQKRSSRFRTDITRSRRTSASRGRATPSSSTRRRSAPPKCSAWRSPTGASGTR